MSEEFLVTGGPAKAVAASFRGTIAFERTA